MGVVIIDIDQAKQKIIRIATQLQACKYHQAQFVGCELTEVVLWGEDEEILETANALREEWNEHSNR